MSQCLQCDWRLCVFIGLRNYGYFFTTKIFFCAVLRKKANPTLSFVKWSRSDCMFCHWALWELRKLSCSCIGNMSRWTLKKKSISTKLTSLSSNWRDYVITDYVRWSLIIIIIIITSELFWSEFWYFFHKRLELKASMQIYSEMVSQGSL